MRTLEPLDIVRCLAVGMSGYPNLAITPTAICKPQPFLTFLTGAWRSRFQPHPRGGALVSLDTGSPRAIAACRPRSGMKSWEVSHLYAVPDSDDALIALLEQSAALSARGGAERVFLRIEADSDITTAARRAGFFPCCRETLYRRQSPASVSRRGLFDTDSHSTKRGPEHDHTLFRLYNETTPLKVRQLAGMTLDQWKDSRERPIGRRRERVVEVDGAVRSWLATSVKSGVGQVEMTLHPDYASLVPDIVDFALRSLVKTVKTRSVVSVVPEHIPLLGGALEERGFRPEAEFAVLVKSTARMAMQPVAAPTSLAAE